MEAHAVDQEQGGQGQFKRRLGRGLNALLGNGSDEYVGHNPSTIPMHALSSPPAPSTDEISMELLERNPYQPRREFEPAAIDELAESIENMASCSHSSFVPARMARQGTNSSQASDAGEQRNRSAWRLCRAA